VEAKAWEYIQRIDAMGGAVAAIEQGYIQKEIAASAYIYQNLIEKGEKIIVGVNKFQVKEKPLEDILMIDDSVRNMQVEKIKRVKAERDNNKVKQLLQAIEESARSGSNLMPHILAACENYATLGEIAVVMRKVFGEYKA
jgi:methylmalonyl-CoA mutase N-terminal domain/subunit